MNYKKLINLYAQQRLELGMSESYIAERAGLSQPTVHRIFTAEHDRAAWNDLILIGEVLGITIDMDGIHICAAEEMIQKKAEEIADAMTRVMQATNQLENQGINKKEQERLKKENILWLLSGSRKKLWMED